MHNPNPFDFVPFADGPVLKTPEEFEALGNQWSGYLEVKLEALTPVHIVGYQQRDENEGQSFIYTQNDQPCIPAASIRGCLRAFVEALTSGWVSQANLEYEKIPGSRHIGFRTFETYPNNGHTMKRKSPFAVNPDFRPNVREGNKIDVATYLFGMVIDPKKEEKEKPKPLVRKSKVWIEDAFIDKADIEDKEYWVPDIAGTAFMGGAKPSASSWWYFQPGEVWERNVPGRPVAEFVGNKYWGRKFYYHQDPQKCVNFYHKSKKNWSYNRRNDFYQVWLQCLKPKTSTKTFRIYLDKVPEPLIILLTTILNPGNNIRHKLGYGKAYGYGSIEFAIQSAWLREEDGVSRIPQPLTNVISKVEGWRIREWDKDKLNNNVSDLVDWKALPYLARILGWTDCEKLLFTYPPFSQEYLFSINSNLAAFISELDKTLLSVDLRKQFQKHGFVLTPHATVKVKEKEKGFKWLIIDDTNGEYSIQTKKYSLDVYRKGFAQTISFQQFKKKAPSHISIGNHASVMPSEARNIADNLFNLKKPLHFQVYQERAQGWDIISARKP